VNTKKINDPLPSLSARGLRIAIVGSRFNRIITESLVEGAESCVTMHKGNVLKKDILWVPGAFELPLTAEVLARTRRYHAIICLGAVIRGETPHFDYVAGECARGIQDVMLRHRIPVSFGVLTTNTLRQAKARSGGAHGNKGWDAALTAIEMALLMKKMKSGRRS
jgi:6,7-dimethyl-8-ribityllumazine synthase